MRLLSHRGTAAGAWALATFLALGFLAGGPGVSRPEAEILEAASETTPPASASPPLGAIVSRASLAAGSAAGLGHLRSSRLGTALAGALLSALLAGLAFELAGAAGAHLAPALFWLAPRHLHAGLVATPDLLGAALSLGAIAAYRLASAAGTRRARTGFALLAGVTFGLALSARTGAWVLLPALGLHAGLAQALARRRRDAASRSPSWTALGAMAILGPALLVAAWPGVLRAPLSAWIAPGPFSPAAALLPLAAVPLTLLWTYAGGAAHAGVRLVRSLRAQAGASAFDELLLLAAVAVPLAALAIVPSPSGTRAFLPAAPFLALLGARALLSAARETWPSRAAPLAASAALLVLYPAARAVLHFHPSGASAWNGLVGGAPGAASLGLDRQEGAEAVARLLPAVNERAAEGARIWWPGIHPAAVRAYGLDGRLRPDLGVAMGPHDADLALVALDGSGRGRDDEYRAWSAFRTSRPAAGAYLDEVPLAFVLARPGAWR